MTITPWFPVAPGITQLPSAPLIRDNSPTRIVGTIAIETQDAQEVLSLAFPGALDGDGVVDETTNEIWVYGEPVWSNVGENPGPFIESATLIPVWQETVVTNAKVSIGLNLSIFDYSTSPIAKAFEGLIEIDVIVNKQIIIEIQIPSAEIQVNTADSVISTGAAVSPPATGIDAVGVAPIVSSPVSIESPAAHILAQAIVPDATGRIKNLVNIPVLDVSINARIPGISAGSLLALPATQVNILANTPSVSTGVSIDSPITDVAINTLIPEQIGPDPIRVFIPAVNVAITGSVPEIPLPVTINCPSAAIVIAGANPVLLAIPPFVISTFIDSDSNSDTSHVLTRPIYDEGDLLIAVLMWRSDKGILTTPDGWSLYGTYTSAIVSSVGQQNLLVYTKTAGPSEPSSYTWSATTSTRNCGFIAVVRNGLIESVTENYGNGATATIDTIADRLNITAFTWIYASDTGETYSQSALSGSLIQITDSPRGRARISGGYVYGATKVTSTHAEIFTANNPNHGGICIAISGLPSAPAIPVQVQCPSAGIDLTAKAPEILGILPQEQEPGLTLLLEDDLLSLLDF